MIRHLQGDRPRGGHGPLSFRIGAIGVSGSTVEEDHAVAQAGIDSV